MIKKPKVGGQIVGPTDPKWGNITGNIKDQEDLADILKGNLDDVKVDGVSVVNNKVANIHLESALKEKQDTLIAGTGIIINDNKISVKISITDNKSNGKTVNIGG